MLLLAVEEDIAGDDVWDEVVVVSVEFEMVTVPGSWSLFHFG